MKQKTIVFLIAAASLLALGSSSETSLPKANKNQRYLVLADNGKPAESVIFHGSASSDEATQVLQENKQFSPTELTIKVNQKIAFVNNDEVSHNVYCGGPNFSFNVGAQSPGETDLVEFTKPGKFLVRCAVHLDMKLYVTVK